jgi:hypothetical protein
MTKQQIRSEINKVLDGFPETVLEDVLNYLKEAQKATKKEYVLSNQLKNILEEDRELLKRLAK